MYLFTQGRGGGGLNQREGERGNRSKSWVENTNMTDCTQEIDYLQYTNLNSDKHLPQSPFPGICICSLSLIFYDYLPISQLILFQMFTDNIAPAIAYIPLWYLLCRKMHHLCSIYSTGKKPITDIWC